MYRFYCVFFISGFAGELCNYEYNECESNPCLNGGQCIDHISGFSCKCTAGYTGKRCHVKVKKIYFFEGLFLFNSVILMKQVDFCANDPCPDGHRCIDHGDDFSCECPGGRNGPDCNQVPRTVSATFNSKKLLQIIILFISIPQSDSCSFPSFSISHYMTSYFTML